MLRATNAWTTQPDATAIEWQMSHDTSCGSGALVPLDHEGGLELTQIEVLHDDSACRHLMGTRLPSIPLVEHQSCKIALRRFARGHR